MSRSLPIVHAVPDEAWPTQAQAAESLLFSPRVLGPRTSLRRTWVPAMVPWRATEEGFVSPAVIDWYARFASGKPGVLVLEATGIRDVASGPLLRIGHDRYLDGLRQVVDAVRQASEGQTLVLIQLIDFLAIKRRPDREKYLRRFLEITSELREKLSALLGDPRWTRASESQVRERLIALDDSVLSRVLDPRALESLTHGHRERVTDTHLEHIRTLPQVLPTLFAEAALRAEKAGFDGVELHYAHAYTMASFLSATNQRDDGYGGTLEGRARLPREVVRAVCERVSPSFVVGCRLLGDESIEGGSTCEDAAFFALQLAHDGLHFVSVSKGGKFDDAAQPKVGHAAYPYTGPSGHECMPTVRSDARGPFGRNLALAREIRERIRSAGLDTPVVAAGGIHGFAIAERALRDGDCDFAASARQTLADPDWFEKARLGRGAEVRRCKFTNYCEALDQHHKEVTCQRWDRIRPGDLPESPSRIARDGRRRLIAPEWQP